MGVYRTQVPGAEPSVHAHYLYDAAGGRVKKLLRKQGGQISSTTYIDGIFEHDKADGIENTTLHVMDDQSRIATVRVGPPLEGDKTPATKFILSDHLGSASVTLGEDGKFISREEYRPYGETSFGSYAKKRYRFTGKERDEESGLYLMGQRYYACWLCRWTAPDPAGTVDGTNLYAYVRGSPMGWVDPSGTERWESGCSKGADRPTAKVHGTAPSPSQATT